MVNLHPILFSFDLNLVSTQSQKDVWEWKVYGLSTHKTRAWKLPNIPKADKALLTCFPRDFCADTTLSHSHTQTHIHTCLSSTALCKIFLRFSLPLSDWMQLCKMTFSTENFSHFPSCTKLALNMLAQSSPPVKDFTLVFQTRTDSSIIWSHGIKLFSFFKRKYSWFTRLY